ncbi:response regulator transcription factor [Microbacterium sp. AK031]|uniref:response regulator n=1 Tax=Microbacterium sp. AK031 TaxID=2723076 RepID=UPI00216849AE|nr:response regulator transcription factor [Microbacterium sp. AK031]MCS3844306.1 DNA-binding NarL/FixJ family response regulator [Microbacterium sp. AK031]
MTESIRVLLVDDQELIRVGFRLVLEAEPDMVVAGEAADGDEAIRRARELRPDVVLMDIRMPGLDGIAATEAIVSSMPGTRVLVLTTFDLDEYAFGAIRAGASGFLLKDAQRHEMTSAVRSVHRGDAALSPRITRRLLEHLGPRLPSVEDASDPTAALTERERDVFRTIARGLTNAEIAQELHLSESTVKTHVGRVLMKLEARDRIHAVILAHQYGMS